LSTLIGVPVLPELSKELGADSTQIPIVVSAALITVVLTQFFTGFLADRFSTRLLILIGALVGSLSSLLCVIATHWSQLAILRVIGGIADAITMPALLAVTATLSKDQPGKFFGILRGSQGLSFVVGPILGSIFSLWSLRVPFVVDGLLSLVAFVVVFLMFQDRNKARAEHNLSVFKGLRTTFADNRVFLYLLMGISGLFSFGILYSFVPTKAELLGLDAWQIGLILGGGAVIYSIISYTIGFLSDHYGRRWFVFVSQILIVMGGTGLIYSSNFVTLFAFYGLFCVGETITYLLCFVYATEIFDERYIGTAMGAFDSLMDLSLFVGPVMAISMYKVLGNINPIFLLAIFPACIAFFSVLKWLPRESS
jgi:MFS family permease